MQDLFESISYNDSILSEKTSTIDGNNVVIINIVFLSSKGAEMFIWRFFLL